MGRAKWKMMEDEEQGFVVDEDKWVCADEFPHQEYLRDAVSNSFEAHACFYCGEEKQVIKLKEVVERVYDSLNEIFEDPAESLPFESHDEIYDDLDGTGLHKEGAGYILPDGHHIMTTEEALIDAGFEPLHEELISDVADCIIHNDWVYKGVIESTDDERLQFNWKTFWKNTIREYRGGKPYEEIKQDNALYLNYMKEALSSNLHALSKTLPKGFVLYRCVNYKLVPDPLEASNLWAPPVRYASSQRMSREGQSRFYASFDAETPLKEAVSNASGETACLGVFELTRDIKILDFTNLPEARILNCPDLLAFRFFRLFAEDITQPVKDDEKELYVPTQIMRDIIEEAFIEAGIMGIKYDSVKGTTSENVVLFLDEHTCANYLSLKETKIIPPK